MNSQTGVGRGLDRSPNGPPDCLGHVLRTEKLRSRGAIALAGVPRRIHQRRDADSCDILVGRRRVAAVAKKRGKHAEMDGHPNRQQVVVSKITRGEDRMRHSRRHGEQLVDQPVLPGHERGMRGARQPLCQADDLFEAGFLRSNCTSNRPTESCTDRVADNNRRAGRPSACRRCAQHRSCRRQRSSTPLRLQPRAAAVLPAHHRADGIAGLQQFGNNDDAVFPVAPVTMIRGLVMIASFFEFVSMGNASSVGP